jgi:hypothetical protein
MEARPDLDVEQDDKFQKREWRVEKLGTVLLVLFILAGLLGFLGHGPFSQTTVESEAGTVQVDYQRIIHHLTDEDLSFQISGDAVQNDKVTLVLTGPWTSEVDITGISPQPSTQYAVPGGVALEFEVLRPGDLEINLSYRSNGFWLLDAQATVGDDSVGFPQLVLP